MDCLKNMRGRLKKLRGPLQKNKGHLKIEKSRLKNDQKCRMCTRICNSNITKHPINDASIN